MDSKPEDQYKPKSVKIELSNTAAHNLMKIDLTEQWDKPETDCEEIDLKILSLNHQDESKQMTRNNHNGKLTWES